MFYSHEILTSQAYGVATVWLVSTIGLRSSTKKISRKAIQEVNVQKACETILQPGAPIALRLQGSLLYGLSRVYSQQCHYVLIDAEKVQAHMRAFYSALGGSDNALDPQAGKAKRQDIMLEDDPAFDLNPNLPTFHFDDDGNFVVPAHFSQSSRKTSSQLSPLQPDQSVTSSNRSIIGAFDLSQSPFGGRDSNFGDAFGTGAMTPPKDDNDFLQLEGDDERELQAFDDWGIEIDADGNVIPAAEEPQLPQHPEFEEPEIANTFNDDGPINFDADGDVFMHGALPPGAFHSDPPLPFANDHVQHMAGYDDEHLENPEEQQMVDPVEDNSVQAPVRAQRKRRRAVLAPDEHTKVPRHEVKSWSTNYLANAEKATRPRHGTTITEARKNAFNLVFGCGIAGVGLPTGLPGLPHPLAPDFAGHGLQARLLGIFITVPADRAVETSRGRRRTALEALELEEEEAERRVRRRLNNDEASEAAQHAQQPNLPEHEDDVEVGRRAGSALPDLPSDVPWNRQSSQIPSSSIKAAGSKPPSRHVSASPLHGRGSLNIPGPEIERFSDNQPFLGSDGFGPLPGSGDAGNDSIGSKDSFLLPGTGLGGDTQSTSQLMRAALDREGHNFADYVATVALEKGYDNLPNQETSQSASGTDIGAGEQAQQLRWVNFDALFEPEDQTRAVVAQAFYHVLSLATKNVLRVRQDGQGTMKPFGTIRLGVEV
ncbi:hypothetical protein VTJ04DRAFT_7553 [Mycothermus thermophilus]|uniref:uncharacterized protein n=1 Tax=Humicola insolens TaxID=85995 RepID=UPI0037427FBB